jgi:pimeloyl-ACP methyl ester carboxylesterase
MERHEYNRWMFFYLGYQQGLAAPTGLERLWSHIYRCATADAVIFPPQYWNERYRDLPSFIRRHSGDDPKIVIVGYSYGAYRALELCDSLRRQDLEVDVLVSCDGVARLRHISEWFTLPRLLSYHPHGLKFKVPSNVRRVVAYRQAEDYPRGHDFWFYDKSAIYDEHWIKRQHRWMDEAPEVAQGVFDAAREHAYIVA